LSSNFFDLCAHLGKAQYVVIRQYKSIRQCDAI
jgi:hypothetical protein